MEKNIIDLENKQVEEDNTTYASYKRPIYLTSPQMYGEDVKEVQRRLNALNYNAGTVDGYFGPAGDRAVRDFQGVNGLAVDGSVGPATWNKLFSSTAKPKPGSGGGTTERYEVSPINTNGPDMFTFSVKTGGSYPYGRRYRMYSAGLQDVAKEVADLLAMWVVSQATVGFIIDDIIAFLKGIEIAYDVLGNITILGYMAEYATHLSNLNYHWKKI